ncbi:MAG: WD40 repeat domain-containing protein [Pirellulales bacterium]
MLAGVAAASGDDDKPAASANADVSPSDDAPSDETAVVRPATKVAPLAANALHEIAVLGDGRFRHASTLIHIAVLPDGKRLVASAQDGAARLWDCETGKELQRFYNGQGGYVWCCTPLPGGEQVLTCGSDSRVMRWDVRTGKALKTYVHSSDVFRLAVAPGGERFASTDNDNRTILWNMASGDKVRSFRGHTDSVYGVAIDADGRFLVTCGDDRSVRIWDLADGQSRHKLTTHTDSVYTAAFAPQGVRFATCSDDHSVRVWDAESGNEVWHVALPDTVYVIAWSPDGNRIAATCKDKRIYVLDAKDGKQTLSIAVELGYHWPVAFSADGKSLYSGGSGLVWRWDAQSGKQLFPIPDEKPLIGAVASLAIGPDGETAYLCGQDAQIHVWNVAERRRTALWPMEKPIESLDVSPDGGKLLAADDANVHILDAATGKATATLKCGENLSAAAFVDGGRRVVTIGREQSAYLWDAATGQRVATLSGHQQSIESVCVSADGDRIVTAAGDGTARVWGAHSGSELSRIGTLTKNAQNTMRLPTFLADNRSLAVVDDNKQMKVFLAPSLADDATASAEEVRSLVAALANDRYRIRQDATERLVRVAGTMREHLQNVSTEDPEVAWRLRQIMLGFDRGESPSTLLGKPLALADAPQSLAVHGDGIHFAAVLRVDAAASIVIGRFTKDGAKTLRTIETGRSPNQVAFSADGRRMFAANRDGTVSVFECDSAGSDQ